MSVLIDSPLREHPRLVHPNERTLNQRSLMLSSYTDGSQVVTVIVNYADTEKSISLKCDNARKGKLYVTSIDKDLQYIGKHSLKALSIPTRSIVTVVINGN